MSRLKNILSFFLLWLSFFGFTQNYDYELVYIDTDKIYYSIIQKEGALFFGTNLGIYRIDSETKLIEYDLSVKGAIDKNLNPETMQIRGKLQILKNLN